jgi:arylsulfatase A-like enzyme
VEEAFDGAELGDPAKAKDPRRRAAALGYFPGRSGDLVLVRKAGWLFGDLAANHGSLHDYDQRVPLVLYGAGIKRGRYEQAVSPADVAPTLGALVGIELPRAEGKVLSEVLAR